MGFDTARGLAALPTTQLVRSTVLLHACASRAVVLAGCALLRAAVQRPDDLGLPALLGARHTFFRQFVAGERLVDVQMVAARLSATGVRCIVDHSTEELEHTEVRASEMQQTVATRRQLAICSLEHMGKSAAGVVKPAEHIDQWSGGPTSIVRTITQHSCIYLILSLVHVLSCFQGSGYCRVETKLHHVVATGATFRTVRRESKRRHSR